VGVAKVLRLQDDLAEARRQVERQPGRRRRGSAED
jgi:hypothetical protein